MPLLKLLTAWVLAVVAALLVLMITASSQNFRGASSAASVMPIHRMQRWASSGEDDKLFVDLEQIAVERVPGTEGHRQVLEWITNSLEGNGLWHVERDSFEDSTPHGVKQFTNIIATHNPNATRRLVVAAHLDSKYFEPPVKFVGATDSATCCAMLLDLARALGASLPESDVTLQLIFFDGEEAFVSWTATDSLYGSRHLAERWEQEGMLEGLELFVLLDLIGGKNAAFYSLHENTLQHVDRMQAIEQQLRRARILSRSGKEPPMFKQSSTAHHNGGVEDDHVPFMRRGVPIVHLISLPFPAVWHTPRDTVENLDRDGLRDLNKVLRVFVAEYFGLAPPKPSDSS